MGGTLDGAPGGSRSCRAQVRWVTGCGGIAGLSTSTLGDFGLSMLAGFSTLGTGCCTLGGRRSSHLSFLSCWGAVSSLGEVSTAQLVSVSLSD